MKKVTILDVAREAMVSPTLVSRVMNAPKNPDGSPQCVVNPKTAERIFEAVKKLGYHPNKAAVSLRRGIKKRIGIIIPDIANQFFADMARNFESIASQSGYVVLFGSSNEQADKLEQVAATFIEDGVDGIIITPCVGCEEYVAKIVANGVPVVLAIRDVASITGVSRVLPDDTTSVRLAIDHLFEQGFKKIEMISNTLRHSTVKNREAQFKEYMNKCAESGAVMGASPARIQHYDPESDIEELEIILEGLRNRGADAIFCPSARVPLRCLEAARNIGIRIPEDMALLGYDGGSTYSITSPNISQIEYSHIEIAEKAFTLLMERIKLGNKCPERTISLMPRLVQCESTSQPTDHKDENYCRKNDCQEQSSSDNKGSDLAATIHEIKVLISNLEKQIL